MTYNHIKSLCLAAVIASFLGGESLATEYECLVSRKIDSEHIYKKELIDKYRYSVKVEDSGKSSFLSRCSVPPSAGKVTCDRYSVDKIVFDANAKIKKFYAFNSQFDVQIFSSLVFVENNGRGGIAFGKCRVVSP